MEKIYILSSLAFDTPFLIRIDKKSLEVRERVRNDKKYKVRIYDCVWDDQAGKVIVGAKVHELVQQSEDDTVYMFIHAVDGMYGTVRQKRDYFRYYAIYDVVDEARFNHLQQMYDSQQKSAYKTEQANAF